MTSFLFFKVTVTWVAKPLVFTLNASPAALLGQIKQARGFRRFSLWGLAKVNVDWALVRTAHNLLKMYRARYG